MYRYIDGLSTVRKKSLVVPIHGVRCIDTWSMYRYMVVMYRYMLETEPGYPMYRYIRRDVSIHERDFLSVICGMYRYMLEHVSIHGSVLADVPIHLPDVPIHRAVSTISLRVKLYFGVRGYINSSKSVLNLNL